MTEILDFYFIIKNIKDKKYLKFTTGTLEQLRLEIEVEERGSFYSGNVFTADFHKSVRIENENEAVKILSWLNQIMPNTFEIKCIEIISRPYDN